MKDQRLAVFSSCAWFKPILHVNAAVPHYQISLACLCNVGSSNVSEWQPGSKSTSELLLCLLERLSVCGVVCVWCVYAIIRVVCACLCAALASC